MLGDSGGGGGGGVGGVEGGGGEGGGGGGGCVDWNQYYTTCTVGPTNPFHGAVSFDNIGLAWVAIFLVISLEVGSSSLIGPDPSDTVL